MVYEIKEIKMLKKKLNQYFGIYYLIMFLVYFSGGEEEIEIFFLFFNFEKFLTILYSA